MKAAALLILLLWPTTTGAQQWRTDNIPWKDCVARVLRSIDISTGSVGTIAVNVAGVCRRLYVVNDVQGAYGDVDVVVSTIEKIRRQAPVADITITPGTPQPKGDMRF